MSYASRRSTYLEAEVLSCPPQWLVPLLYEHLLVSLRRAAVQIETRDIEGKCASLERASSIVLELSGALNHEQGGEIAGRLAALYGFFAGEILTVGRTLDAARLQRLVALIAELHEGWVQAAETIAPRGTRPPHSTLALT